MNHTASYVLSLGLKDGSEQQKNVYQGIAKVYTKTSAIKKTCIVYRYIVLKSSKTANHAPPIFAHE